MLSPSLIANLTVIAINIITTLMMQLLMLFHVPPPFQSFWVAFGTYCTVVGTIWLLVYHFANGKVEPHD